MGPTNATAATPAIIWPAKDVTLQRSKNISRTITIGVVIIGKVPAVLGPTSSTEAARHRTTAYATVVAGIAIRAVPVTGEPVAIHAVAAAVTRAAGARTETATAIGQTGRASDRKCITATTATLVPQVTIAQVTPVYRAP